MSVDPAGTKEVSIVSTCFLAFQKIDFNAIAWIAPVIGEECSDQYRYAEVKQKKQQGLCDESLHILKLKISEAP